ncbi:MAG: hypothetical protein JWL77_4386 [Chthonomonadaceae bacterium]|nr:hypothetical protein [Chthonomonadaceae bacterium]
MTIEEQEIVEKLKQMDMEHGLHLLQQVLKHYSQEFNAEMSRHTIGITWDRVFAVILVNTHLTAERGPNAPHFDVLALPDKESYLELGQGDYHQAEAVDLADSGNCRTCELTMCGSKHSNCPICGGMLFLT